jgi:hypothetical protein
MPYRPQHHTKPGSKHHDLTRRQIYDLVWSAPASEVAKELGISDVALGKHCRKLNIPRPTRGDWTRLQWGHEMVKPPLAPDMEEIAKEGLVREVPPTMPIPTDGESLHPVAASLLVDLQNEKPDGAKMVWIDSPALPSVRVSKAQAKRAAEAFHAIITEMESRGIPLRKSRRTLSAAYFERGDDALWLRIKESTSRDTPSGHLIFSTAQQYRRFDKVYEWEETEKMPLEKVIPLVIQGICQYFLDEEKHRIAAMEKREKELQAEVIRATEERNRKHHETLARTVIARETNLLKAAELWRLHQITAEFIDACEKRWRTDQSGSVSHEQAQWLEWARRVARDRCPFDLGYPDPAVDGEFDDAAIEIGGPYPCVRKLPTPPTMP